jgi:beta-mannosidase
LELACGAQTVTVDLGFIAFRNIDVCTTDGDFSVSVNGVRVFCRGACWTPPDPVTLRADETTIRGTIDQVAAAGMNMLRVGGTMVYEDDAFLDECDRRGILLWQDFMFANMDYPAGDSAFDASIHREVTQQLARLQARASLAVLCGNSEGAQQASMWGASRELWQPKLFHETLPALCRDFTEATYWPSSASGGTFPHQSNCGTTSYYGVGAYQRPLEDARRSNVRFASECLAFANVPEPSTIALMAGGHGLRIHHPAWKAATPRDLGAGWDFEDVRDHYLRMLFGVDPAALRYADHDRYLELSRITSAEVMAATFAEWRRGASQCRGALIWFLRDFIAGAGWGIVDALGHPKAAYYAVRRTLQPRSALFSDEGVNGPFVHFLNETNASVTVEATLTAYKRSVTVATATQTVVMPPHSATARSGLEWFDSFRDFSWAYRFGPPTADLLVIKLSNHAEGIIHEGFHFPLGHTAFSSADPGLTARVQSTVADECPLHISTRQFAQYVHIDVDGFDVSDQYFHLSPGAAKTVLLRRRPHTPKRDLRGSVRALNSSEIAGIIVE